MLKYKSILNQAYLLYYLLLKIALFELLFYLIFLI
jgi:hypothetical protein